MLPYWTRELPSSSREAENHPKKCNPRQRFLIHLADSRLQLVCDRAKRRSSVDHPRDYYLSLTENEWNVAGRRLNVPYQIAIRRVKHKSLEIWELCIGEAGV